MGMIHTCLHCREDYTLSAGRGTYGLNTCVCLPIAGHSVVHRVPWKSASYFTGEEAEAHRGSVTLPGHKLVGSGAESEKPVVLTPELSEALPHPGPQQEAHLHGAPPSLQSWGQGVTQGQAPSLPHH